MQITSAIVLYIIIWAMVFFIILPLWQTTQAETGEIVPGTPPSAPEDAMIKKKVVLTTLWASLVYIAVMLIIYYKVITLDMIPFLTPPSGR